jgi:radical SAM protein with 4Fe4S-binding SPASM domain
MRDKTNLNTFSPPPTISGSSFNEQDIEDARKSKSLLSLSLLLSNACNLECRYCYRDAGPSEKISLSLNEWRNIILQAKDLGARNVWIPGSGEPLLDPNFCDGHTFPLIKICNSIGLSVTFFTNGTLLTPDLVNELRSFDVSVVAKLNSFDPDIQDYLAGRTNVSKNIRLGLQYLLDGGFADGSPSRLGLDTVIVAQNINEIPTIFKYCRDRNIIPYITANLHSGRACFNGELEIPQKDMKSLFYHLLDIDQKEYGYNWFPAPPIVGGQCKRLLYDIVVDYRGDVLICPGINIPIGNVLNQPLADIMISSYLFDKIRNMPETLNGKCKTCESDSCTYGCRLEAWSSGDMLGSDPMCWHSTR